MRGSSDSVARTFVRVSHQVEFCHHGQLLLKPGRTSGPRKSLLLMKAPAILTCMIATLPLLAQNVSAEDAPLELFRGSWSGSGQLFGAEARFEMKWEMALNNQFVQLTFKNSFKDSGGRERTLKAQAFYKSMGEGRYRGTWFDSRGMVLPLESTFEDSVLTTLWGSAESENGRTVYSIHADDTIEVDDYINKDGEWQKFGHAVYHRIDGD